MNGILTQTGALFLDAYREINAKKMFWVTLVLSGLIVAVFGGLGINERGISIFRWDFPSIFNTTFIDRPTFYKYVFSELGVGWWLNFFGIMLALISTAGIIPEFVSGGAVDLYLSKPVSRLRLWLTKYATGLTFVGLQVGVFTLGCFLLIGIRAGSWDFRMFYAVPLVLLVFSYLFCVCAVLGLVTRSTVASLLLTLLFWFLIWGVHSAEVVLLMYRTAHRIEATAYQNQFAYLDKKIAGLQARPTDGESARAELGRTTKEREELTAKKERTDGPRRNVAAAHRIFFAVKSVLPKTAETGQLLVRWLHLDTSGVEEEELARRDRRRAARASSNGWLSGFQDRTESKNVESDAEVLANLGDEIGSRSVRWVMGTSLAFEAVVLGLGAWVFCRRDY